jgi:beta-amylase
MKKSLKKAAEAREEPDWAKIGGPSLAGNYNKLPEETRFFKKGGEWNDGYGRFFLSWYSRKLLKHGDRLLAAANDVFGQINGVTLSAKVSGIHWHYDTSSHAAELTAGYYNTRHRDGYLPIMQMLKKHHAVLNFTCVEMRDYEQPAQASSSPEKLVKQVAEAARKEGVVLVGENALPRYDEYAFLKVVDTARREGMSAFTYQRMNPKLFKADNWWRFVDFVKEMSEI